MAAEDARDDERGQDQETSLVPVSTRGRVLRRLGGWRRTEERQPEERQPGERGRVRGFLGTVADRIVDVAPRIPVRDLAALRRQFPGLGPEEMADRLISGAMKGTATVGAGVGAAAMLPVPPAMTAELTAEVVGVATVEIKLIAELHEVYGRRPPGNARQRMVVYLSAWSQERGIDVTEPATLNAALSQQMKRELRQTLLKRTLRNLPNLTPFMIGAVVGALMNRRDTQKLAEKVRRDLRERQVAWSALPAPRRPGDEDVPDPTGPRALGSAD